MKYFSLLFFILVSCHQETLPQPDAPNVIWLCGPAEQNLLSMNCKDSEGRLLGGPNKRGQTFGSVCRNAQQNKLDLNPECLSEAKTCKEAMACTR